MPNGSLIRGQKPFHLYNIILLSLHLLLVLLNQLTQLWYNLLTTTVHILHAFHLLNPNLCLRPLCHIRVWVTQNIVCWLHLLSVNVNRVWVRKLRVRGPFWVGWIHWFFLVKNLDFLVTEVNILIGVVTLLGKAEGFLVNFRGDWLGLLDLL